MRLNIKQAINSPGRRYHISTDIVPEGAQDCDIRMKTPIHLEMDYTFSGEELEACGQVSCHVTAGCDRCLTDVDIDVTGSFEELFSRADEDAYELLGDEIELDRLALDAVTLNLPTKFLCNDDCSGLCPQCGADLNAETCSCVITNAGPFGALAGMFKEDEEV